MSSRNPFHLVRLWGGGSIDTRRGARTDGVGKKLSKIMKSEAVAEKAALRIALKELAEIQKLQKASIEVTLSTSTPDAFFLKTIFFFFLW